MIPFVFTKYWPQVILYTAVGIWALLELCLVIRDIGKTNTRNDQKTVWTVTFFSFAGLFLAYQIAWWFPETRIHRNGWVLLILGAILILAGVWLRYRAVRTLGRFFRRVVMTQDNHHIVTKGPYRLIRHPSYTAVLISMFGVGLALGNWLSILCAVGLTFLGLYKRLMIEEDFLRHHFGDEYKRYMQRTKRLLPFIW